MKLSGEALVELHTNKAVAKAITNLSEDYVHLETLLDDMRHTHVTQSLDDLTVRDVVNALSLAIQILSFHQQTLLAKRNRIGK